MIWLVLGVLLWSALHLVPSAGRPVRTACIGRLGEGPYKGLFALGIVTSIALMIIGWRSSPLTPVYQPPAWGHTVALGLVFLALLLFVASQVPSNLKRLLRHPQLAGVFVWALAHLLANGDRKSLILFGGLGAWALLAMLFINRRDGAWERPARGPLSAEWKPLVGAAVGYALLFLAHPYLSGVALR